MTNIEYSADLSERMVKILLWGKEATRKTESILRYFPRVLLIDTEGNSDQCIGMEEIPPFMRVVTKDVYEIVDILDQVGAGKVKFPGGAPVETVGIDSVSVLWSVRQEAGSLNAERRVKKYRAGASPDDATMTQLDWTIAKRPLKRLYSRMNGNPGVRFFVCTAREKDEFEKVMKNGREELVKVGVIPDVMKGLGYDVNLALHMQQTTGWQCRVTKVQGLLGHTLPVGTTASEFPAGVILEHATGSGTAVQDEVDLAARQLERETVKTRQDLLEEGAKRGLSAGDIGEALKAAGMQFDPSLWDRMVEVVTEYSARE